MTEIPPIDAFLAYERRLGNPNKLKDPLKWRKTPRPYVGVRVSSDPLGKPRKSQANTLKHETIEQAQLRIREERSEEGRFFRMVREGIRDEDPKKTAILTHIENSREKFVPKETKSRYRSYLRTERWGKKRSAFLEENPYCCKCGKLDPSNNVHHMYYRSTDGGSVLGREQDCGLRTLCAADHKAYHFSKGDARREWDEYLIDVGCNERIKSGHLANKDKAIKHERKRSQRRRAR